MIPDWSDDHYTGDQFPTHWNEERVQEYSIKYEAMPEEHYTSIGFPVVTPDSFERFLALFSPMGPAGTLQWIRTAVRNCS